MKAISFDVGPSRFMMAEANVTGREVHLQKVFPIDVPMGSIADGIISDHSSVRSAIEVTLKANKVHTKNAVVTVSSNTMVIRKLEVPLANDKDTKNLVNVEMQQYLPTGKKFMVDYVTLSETVSPHGGKMSVVKAAALPAELCDGYYKLLLGVGLKAQQMDIHPQVLGRVFAPDIRINDRTVGSQPIIAVDMSQFQTSINVILGGEVDLTRSLPVGIANLERTVADRMQSTPDEARAYIRKTMDFKQDTTEAVESARRFLTQVIQEVRKVQQYLRAKNLAETSRVYLYGIGSGFIGLDSYMTENLEIDTETIRSHNLIHMPMMDKTAQLGHYLNAAGALLKA